MSQVTHADVQNALILLKYGVLEPELASAVESHLNECDDCRGEWSRLLHFYDRLSGPQLAVALPDGAGPHPSDLDLSDILGGVAPETAAAKISVRVIRFDVA